MAGLPTRPRSILPRTRRALAEHADSTPVFVAKVRADAALARTARQRRQLIHELAESMDHSALDTITVEAVLGLMRYYIELAEEVIARLQG